MTKIFKMESDSTPALPQQYCAHCHAPIPPEKGIADPCGSCGSRDRISKYPPNRLFSDRK